MSLSYESDIYDLLDEARLLEPCPTQVMLLEQAAALADTHQDVSLGFEVRERLIDAATFGGAAEKALIAFSWCLAQCDRDPEQFDEEALLWKYKWIVGSLPKFVAITRQQMEAMLTDMQTRYERAGSSLHPLYKLRRYLAIDCGDRAAAAVFHDLLQKTQADHRSDCQACQVNGEVTYLVFQREYAKAIKKAAKILRGHLSCSTIPQSTYASLVLPLVYLGRAEEAVEFYRKSYKTICGNSDYLWSISRYLVLMAVTDNLGEAVKVFQKHLPLVLMTREDDSRFEFLRAAFFLFDRQASSGKGEFKLRLPKSFPLHQGDGIYNAVTLREWFFSQASALAARFNTRNGNDYYTEQMQMVDQWTTLVHKVVLRPRKK